jgi:hypothetical protein
MSASVTTMYEDRIVASDLLFDMSRIIQKKQLALVGSDTDDVGQMNDFHQKLNLLTEKYLQTKLTEKETLVFSKLQEKLQALEDKELKTEPLLVEETLKTLDVIHQYLFDLSKIQVEEGRQQVFISNKARDTIELFTQGEIIFLVFMAIVIQIIIFYKPREFIEK